MPPPSSDILITTSSLPAEMMILTCRGNATLRAPTSGSRMQRAVRSHATAPNGHIWCAWHVACGLLQLIPYNVRRMLRAGACRDDTTPRRGAAATRHCTERGKNKANGDCGRTGGREAWSPWKSIVARSEFLTSSNTAVEAQRAHMATRCRAQSAPQSLTLTIACRSVRHNARQPQQRRRQQTQR